MEQSVTNFINSPWWGVISSTIALASMVAAITPNQADNTVIKVFRAVIDALALNFAHAKNEPDTPGQPTLMDKVKFWKKD